MFCGVFYSRSRRGGERKRGFAGGEFRKAAGIAGVFPIYRNEMGTGWILQNGGECKVGLPYLPE